jgi:hypothetical protein
MPCKCPPDGILTALFFKCRRRGVVAIALNASGTLNSPGCALVMLNTGNKTETSIIFMKQEGSETIYSQPLRLNVV